MPKAKKIVARPRIKLETEGGGGKPLSIRTQRIEESKEEELLEYVGKARKMTTLQLRKSLQDGFLIPFTATVFGAKVRLAISYVSPEDWEGEAE